MAGNCFDRIGSARDVSRNLRLTRPVGTKQQLHNPLQNPISSNEPEFFLLGKMEVSRRDLDLRYRGLYGHIIDLPRESYGAPEK